jgi:predicted secreted Zn-dependent protease
VTTIAEFKKAIRQDGNLLNNIDHRNSGRALIYIQNQITFARNDGKLTCDQAESLYNWSHDYAEVVANKTKRKYP